MRVVVVGDTHIGAIFGLGRPNGAGSNTRIDDYANTLEYIVNYCIEKQVDIFVQTGDVFEIRKPSPEHMAIVDHAIKRLSNAGITSVWLMGNHDYIRTSSTEFTSSIVNLGAKDYPNVRIVLEPTILNVESQDGTVNLVLLPYRDKRMYSEGSIEAASFGYEAHVRKLIKECDPETPTIAIGHNFYFEGSYNDFSGSEILARPSAFQGCDLVAMGHYHNFRIVKKANPVTIYTGSMEKINFSDKDRAKYFIDYDTNEKEINIIKTPVRELEELNINLSHANLENYMEELAAVLEKEDLDGKIVRVNLQLKERVASFVKKNHIYDLLYKQKCHYVSALKMEVIQKRMIRDVSILQHKTDIDIFKAFVKKQDLDSEIRELILKRAEDIMRNA